MSIFLYAFLQFAKFIIPYQERITFEDIENSELGEFIKEQKNKPERERSDLLADGEPTDNYPNTFFIVNNGFGFIVRF